MKEKEEKTVVQEEKGTKEKTKMKKNSKIVIIIAIILAILIVIGGGFFTYDRFQKQALIVEINKVSRTDISKETINVDNIKTKGKYGKIEKAIKSYMNDYATTLQETMSLIINDQFNNLLTTKNYKEDGPEFIKSKEFIIKTKQEFKEKVEKLQKGLTEESVLAKIEPEGLDKKSVELYKNLMFDEQTKKELEATNKKLEQTANQISSILDIQEQIFNFLTQNNGKWEISGNQIMFQTQTLVKEYNGYITKIRTIQKK